VSLDGADLTGADLRGAVLTDGSLRRAILVGSHWQYAALLGTRIGRSPGELAEAAIPGRDQADAMAETPSDAARCAAFSPDGALLAYGSGMVAKIADITTGRTLRILRGHQRTLTDIAFSPDGIRIATGDGDGIVRIWDLTSAASAGFARGPYPPPTGLIHRAARPPGRNYRCGVHRWRRAGSHHLR
jgi:hypothetical protein